jgi:hypothetical protein
MISLHRFFHKTIQNLSKIKEKLSDNELDKGFCENRVIAL